MRHTACQQ